MKMHIFLGGFVHIKKGYGSQKNDIPMEYNLIREAVKFKATQIGLDEKKFSTHSMRSGGATAASSSCVNDRIMQRHGRWASVESRNRYVKDSLESRLAVSKSIKAIAE
jgi:hypothetical protein